MVYIYICITDSCLMLPKFQSTLTSEWDFTFFISLSDVEDILKNWAPKHRKCLLRDLILVLTRWLSCAHSDLLQHYNEGLTTQCIHHLPNYSFSSSKLAALEKEFIYILHFFLALLTLVLDPSAMIIPSP